MDAALRPLGATAGRSWSSADALAHSGAGSLLRPALGACPHSPRRPLQSRNKLRDGPAFRRQ
eukprot:5330574-Pyramimonas_sp.AAC.1